MASRAAAIPGVAELPPPGAVRGSRSPTLIGARVTPSGPSAVSARTETAPDENRWRSRTARPSLMAAEAGTPQREAAVRTRPQPRQCSKMRPPTGAGATRTLARCARRHGCRLPCAAGPAQHHDDASDHRCGGGRRGADGYPMRCGTAVGLSAQCPPIQGSAEAARHRAGSPCATPRPTKCLRSRFSTTRRRLTPVVMT